MDNELPALKWKTNCVSLPSSNPVTVNTVRENFGKLGLKVSEAEETDYAKLLAAVHDIAETVEALPDYHPPTDLGRFPRNNLKRPTLEENVLGHAWAHTYSIKDDSIKGPLSGKTVCLKDCIAVAGVPMLLGTEIIDPWTPEADATVVTWALEAGAEIVGSAQCENWCQSTSSSSSAQGTIHNPHAVGYSAGGSTSGAAALVGAGLVDMAIGADQGGSIRVPAALCGIVGLKPTHGLVPYTGFGSNDAINDHAGPLAKTVLETAQLLDAISGYDGIDDRGLGAGKKGSFKFAESLSSVKDLKGVKIGILKEAFDMPILDAAVKDAVLAAASKFTTLGAEVKEISVPIHPLGNAIWTIEQRVSGSLTLQGKAHGRRGYGLVGLEKAKTIDQSSFQKFFPTTKNTLVNGMYLMEKFPSLYNKALNLSRKMRDDYEKALEEVDVLILPTTSFVARKHGEDWKTGTPIKTIDPTVGLTANTVQFDATGQPGITIPIGWLPSAEDEKILMPVGMQIVSGLWKDEKCLKVGYAWEQAFDWKKIMPEGCVRQEPVVKTTKTAAATAES
jgi:amidase